MRLTAALRVYYGVPQGSVLGPLFVYSGHQPCYCSACSSATPTC